MQSKTLTFAILVIISPVLFALVYQPDSFSLSWNQGRGGWLFATAFIVAELVGIKLVISKNKVLMTVPLAGAVIAYLILLDHGLRNYIKDGAKVYDVHLINSWTWLWDFVIMAAFVIAVVTILFGKRWIRIAPAGPIFLCGSAIILSLDAFFPYDTLGPLQYVVPYLVKANVEIIKFFHLGTAIARDNLMFLSGDHGHMALQVFWPSAGVHSVIIYSLVMMAFLLKMNIIPKRKAMYFAIGIAGTIGVNIIRIFSLSLFVLKVSANPTEFEQFHGVAGEIMFLPWLFAYLFAVTAIETKRLKKQAA
ncbi:MAG: thaumarchaeosortase [Nitrososphaeria archaeon]|nr:thaumarchaeosortase [Nitrososphaeria archaeon]NDB62937.1 thaumarchaeosortase [Nitrosopumilaceae archaeon]NDB87497.1 thaumarchaeosortase [Nitrososphaerota archaeon]NDB89435.1 thaumarchaeosortase [Nitrososphaerota archaeon]NDB92139.1 thaumarchaeosortase [Nitrososphaeria archaeon]